ncbi:glycosyltransferase family 2 protein [Sphingomonas sp. ACRSK]|uniref:glycosyltransferase family 2 protein n=1 Tax=Sphingomonas sp. ACRSK TaxID=2918213 RepID=UPI001EF3F3EF|nr:glycosyltransferase [Sphingomonas sp. ACRSK]MCG7349502.1 glycosyltransferase [Sphingomonas sp. ACRSK]
MSDPITSKSPTAPVLSMVIATLGRTTELDRLFQSLEAQTRRDFDVVVVDQNDDDRLGTLTARWSERLSLRRLRTPGERGLSVARNRGWPITTGTVLLFPDDDCWYPPHFVADALATMEQHGADVLAGRAATPEGRSINGRYELAACRSTRHNIWTTGIEWVMLFRRTVLETVGGYSEDVGVGAASPWQACEGVDIVLRADTAGFSCWFDPALAGHHEEIVTTAPDLRARRKARAYGRGMGHVLRRFDYSSAAKANWIARPGAGAVVSLLSGRRAKAAYYLQVALGRLEGVTDRLIG